MFTNVSPPQAHTQIDPHFPLEVTERSALQELIYEMLIFTFTFTFMHLADAFIQSDLHCIQVTVFYIWSALAFPGNRTHDLGVASAMLYHLSYRKAIRKAIICYEMAHGWEMCCYDLFFCAWLHFIFISRIMKTNMHQTALINLS